MRTVKIVADSSANLMELKTVAFDAAPLKIITAQRESCKLLDTSLSSPD